jgi:hypothetical protein
MKIMHQLARKMVKIKKRNKKDELKRKRRKLQEE